jgi:heme exporter protein B
MPSLSTAIWQTFKRDCIVVMRKRMDVFNPLVFGFVVALTFPLGLGPSAQTLSILAPGLVWVIALLSCLLATDGLFQEDYDDGSLTLMLLSPQPTYFLVMARLWAHWLKSGLTVSVIAPLLGLMLYLPSNANAALVASLLLGTVSLIFIGGIGAALTVGMKNSGVLLTLIILPLYVPVLIFGSAAVQAAAQNMPVSSYLALLGAFMCLSVALAPLAVQAGLTINQDAA